MSTNPIAVIYPFTSALNPGTAAGTAVPSACTCQTSAPAGTPSNSAVSGAFDGVRELVTIIEKIADGIAQIIKFFKESPGTAAATGAANGATAQSATTLGNAVKGGSGLLDLLFSGLSSISSLNPLSLITSSVEGIFGKALDAGSKLIKKIF